MTATALAIENLTVDITHETFVRASLDATFEALLEQMGPANETPDGQPMPMTIEPRPGGRWFRDLGQDNGHFWGHVQAIERPTLLEITGPLFMSSPVLSNMQYRLKEADGGTLIAFRHSALGLVPDEFRRGLAPWLGDAAQSHQEQGRGRPSQSAREEHAHDHDRRLVQELGQEAQTTRRVPRARAGGSTGVEAAREIDVARPAGHPRGHRSPAPLPPFPGIAVPVPAVQPAECEQRGGAGSDARAERCKGRRDSRWHDRRGSRANVAAGRRRSRR